MCSSSKTLTVAVGPGYKILREWIRCLYNNTIDRLCVATKDLTNDQREQTLQLGTSQLANCVLRVVTCITSRGDLKRIM